MKELLNRCAITIDGDTFTYGDLLKGALVCLTFIALVGIVGNL